MSWQSGLACWILRKWFYPRTRAPHFDVEHIRALASRRLWLPRVPSGWRLAEHYAADGGLLRGEWLEPATDAAGSPAGGTILYLHGGGYFFCSPRTHRALVFGLAKRTRARTFSLDYRLAPEHRFPAALDDALAAYRQLLSEGTAPESIVVAGDSAGGASRWRYSWRCVTQASVCPRAGCCFRHGPIWRPPANQSALMTGSIR